VRRIVADTAARTLQYGDAVTACAIGRGGACDAADKREGDGRTPRGRWPIRAVLLRPDRGLVPPAHLPWRWLRTTDGWSDDPADPVYNRPVRHPHDRSAERLWRADGLYDAILVIGHNDLPPRPDAGSAIFLHLREGEATEGCVAVPRAAMRDLLAELAADAVVDIV
jgi:L,D-peptidoglycan transpeptidase YkuD (ErfK/YbiS/YcfS/YnhG family)